MQGKTQAPIPARRVAGFPRPKWSAPAVGPGLPRGFDYDKLSLYHKMLEKSARPPQNETVGAAATLSRSSAAMPEKAKGANPSIPENSTAGNDSRAPL